MPTGALKTYATSTAVYIRLNDAVLVKVRPKLKETNILCDVMPINNAYISARSSPIPNYTLSISTWSKRAIVITTAALAEISVLPSIAIVSGESWFCAISLFCSGSAWCGTTEWIKLSRKTISIYDAPMMMPAIGTMCHASSIHSSFSWAIPSYVSGIVCVRATPMMTPPPSINSMLWTCDVIKLLTA